jgi:hypothetical protein
VGARWWQRVVPCRAWVNATVSYSATCPFCNKPTRVHITETGAFVLDSACTHYRERRQTSRGCSECRLSIGQITFRYYDRAKEDRFERELRLTIQTLFRRFTRWVSVALRKGVL